MIQYGELASAVTGQSACRELLILFREVSSIAGGGMFGKWRERNRIASLGVRTYGSF